MFVHRDYTCRHPVGWEDQTMEVRTNSTWPNACAEFDTLDRAVVLDDIQVAALIEQLQEVLDTRKAEGRNYKNPTPDFIERSRERPPILKAGKLRGRYV